MKCLNKCKSVQLISVAVLCVFLMLCHLSCQNQMKDENSLQGTKWKLVGLYNAKTDKLKVFETRPRDCEDCYTLTFLSDTVVVANIDEAAFRAVGAEKTTITFDLSNSSPRPIWRTGLAPCGYPDVYETILGGMYSYDLSDDKTELRCYVDPSYVLDYFCHYEYVLDSPNPNHNREIYFLYKKYGSFQPEKEDDGDPQLPPNLKGTRWKLESAYTELFERYSTAELMDGGYEPKPIDNCEECFTFTFVTESEAYGLMTTQHYRIDFSEKYINVKMVDADNNEVGMGGDRIAYSDDINRAFITLSSVYSISETEMKLYSGCDYIVTFKKL